MTILAKAVMIASARWKSRSDASRSQESRIRELEPKALFADALPLRRHMPVGELGEDAASEWFDIGQNRLFFRLLL